MKPSLATIDILISLDGTKHLIESLAREGAEQSLARFYGFFSDKEMDEIIKEATRNVSITHHVQRTYGEHFDQDDMENMIAFFKTPSGEKMARARSKLMLGFMLTLNKVVDSISSACVKEALKRVIKKHDGD